MLAAGAPGRPVYTPTSRAAWDKAATAVDAAMAKGYS